jgi:hypothetical protein
VSVELTGLAAAAIPTATAALAIDAQPVRAAVAALTALGDGWWTGHTAAPPVTDQVVSMPVTVLILGAQPAVLACPVAAVRTVTAGAVAGAGTWQGDALVVLADKSILTLAGGHAGRYSGIRWASITAIRVAPGIRDLAVVLVAQIALDLVTVVPPLLVSLIRTQDDMAA